MKKPVKYGEDFVRDANWQPITRTRTGAERLGMKLMPPDLKRLGFSVSVFEADEYFRISYGRKV
jgi:hypothetical protein